MLIAIDDFGTGYSSLGCALPVNSLKLDKSFVMGMRNNSDDRIIVESGDGHALKLELVAKAWNRMGRAVPAAAGYDFAQGFRYSRAFRPTNVWPGSWIQCHRDAHLAFGVTAALRARAGCEVDDLRVSRSARENEECPHFHCGFSRGTQANPIWNPTSGVLLRFCRFSVTPNDTRQQSKR